MQDKRELDKLQWYEDSHAKIQLAMSELQQHLERMPAEEKEIKWYHCSELDAIYRMIERILIEFRLRPEGDE